MKANLFSPLLILLIFTLCAKASVLLGQIQEHTVNSSGAVASSSASSGASPAASSILVNTAYASADSPSADSGAQAEDKPQASTTAAAEDKSKDKSKDIGKDTTKEAAHAGSESSSGKPRSEKEDKAKPKDPGAVISDTPGKTIDLEKVGFSKSEMNLLKELSKRRDTLDKEKQDITAREQILKATEGKIDQKVTELKTLQSQLEGLMKQYDQKENGKILSLVKIYETMKPKEAAKILNELEMPILIKVVSNMKEVKVAPIIASMDAAKARDLSIELAKQKPIE